MSAISDRHSAMSKLHANVTINYGDRAIIGQFPVSENTEVIIITKYISAYWKHFTLSTSALQEAWLIH